MQKTIYDGKPIGLFSHSAFYEFMDEFPKAELVMARGQRDNNQSKAYHINPEGVSLRYDFIINQARVTLFGNEDKISEIERRILHEARRKKYK